MGTRESSLQRRWAARAACLLAACLVLSPPAGRAVHGGDDVGGTAVEPVVRFWIEQLEKEDETRWKPAAAILAVIGAPAVPTLVDLAAKDGSPMAPKALAALVLMGPEARTAVASIARFLGSQDAEIRQRAVEGLALVGPEAESALPALVRLAADPVPRVAAAVALAIEHIGKPTPEVLAALETVLGREDRGGREEAAIALAKFGAEGLSVLLRAAKADPDTPGAVEAADEVAELAHSESPPSEAVAAILDGLGGKGAVRVTLGRNDWYAPKAGVLLLGMKHADAKVRAACAQRIGALGWDSKKPDSRRDEAIAALRATENDSSIDVRREGAIALGRMGLDAPRALPFVIEVLGRELDETFSAAVKAAAKLGAEAMRAREALKGALARASPREKERIVETLAVFAPTAKADLIALRDDPSEDVRETAARQLRRLEPPPSEEELIHRLETGTGDLFEAAETLARSGPIGATIVYRKLADPKRTRDVERACDAAFMIPGTQHLREDIRIDIDPAVLIAEVLDPPRGSTSSWTARQMLLKEGVDAVAPLVESIRSSKVERRVQGINLLALFGAPAHAALLEFLRDGDEKSRRSVFSALRDAKEKSLPLLQTLLAGSDDDLRYRAARGLLWVAPRRSDQEVARLPDVPEPRRATEFGDRFPSEEVARVWKESRDAFPAAMDVIAKAWSLHPPDHDDRQEALGAAAAAPVAEFLPLVKAALQSVAPKDEKEIASLVSYVRGAGRVAWPSLVEALGDPASALTAARILREVGPRAAEIAPALRERLASENATIRAAAAVALAGIVPSNPLTVLPQLREALRADPLVAAAAVEALRAMGRSAAPAGSGLLDAAFAGRVTNLSVARAWKRMGRDPHDAIETFEAGRASRTAAVRDDSAFALATLGMGGRGVVETLMQAMKGARGCDSPEEAKALEALAALGPDAVAAFPALLDCVVGTEGTTAHLGTLLALREAAVPLLIALFSERGKEFWGILRTLLGWIGKPAVPGLVAALRDGPPEQRAQIAYALGLVGPDARSAVPLLQPMLSGEDPGRFEAALALLRIGEGYEPAIPVILDSLVKSFDNKSNSDALVRFKGDHPKMDLARAMGDLGPRGAIFAPYLALVVEPTLATANPKWQDISEDDRFRATAAEALGKIPPVFSRQIEALRRGLGEKTAADRFNLDGSLPPGLYCACSLVALGQAEEARIPEILGAALDPGWAPYRDPDQRDKHRREFIPAALRALGRLGTLASPYVPAMEYLLRESDAEVRLAAVKALGALGPVAVAAAPDLEQATLDDDEDVRAAATASLAAVRAKGK